MTLDYPRIRASLTCPLCSRPKDQGLVACWPCHRQHLKHGETLITARTLEMTEIRFIEQGV